MAKSDRSISRYMTTAHLKIGLAAVKKKKKAKSKKKAVSHRKQRPLAKDE
jgi:hypothetical protein